MFPSPFGELSSLTNADIMKIIEKSGFPSPFGELSSLTI